MVDAAGVDGRNPRDDLRQLLEELTKYDPVLTRKPAIVLANKVFEANLAFFFLHPVDFNLSMFHAAWPFFGVTRSTFPRRSSI